MFISFRQLSRSFRRSHRLGLALVVLGLCCASHPAWAQDPMGVAGKLLSSNTKKNYSKSNQSKVFFHDGAWWALAYNKSFSKWYVWKYSADADTWTANASAGNISSSYRPDVVLDAAANKLYIVFSTSNTPEFYRMSYSVGTWNIDAGFPKLLSDFIETDSGSPASLVRAANGDLWIFRIESKLLEALRSTDNGNNWPAKFTIKSGLNYKKGTTDAKVFSFGGQNYIGLAYGEELKTGASSYGFLYHRDGDATTTWTDESVALTQQSGINATGGICLAVDAANSLYLLTQNGNALGTSAGNTLYKRNATTGLWQAFNVNTSDTWTSPAIAVQGSSKLYLMGINIATNKAEYKIIAIGRENLAGSTFISPLFDNGADVFTYLSAPLSTVDGSTQLMVCAENYTASKIWYSLVTISSSSVSCNPPTAAGPAAIEGSKGGTAQFYKPNQSKVFFHDGTWWAAAPDAIASEWFLWRKQGSAWAKAISLGTPGSIRPDCYIDSGNNKLYVFEAHTSSSGPKFLRLTYNPDDGTWATDSGFPVALNGFTYQGENPGVLTRAKNGDFWVFVPRSLVLYARHSMNGGLTWSSDIIVKNLPSGSALCDAVTFSSNGQNYVGVGYGESTAPLATYGFLMHKDGDADNVWSDESSQLPAIPNAQADDHISMCVSASNEVFMAVKTHPNLAGAAGVNLYKRAANSGWSSFTAFTGSAETRPGVVIDETNNELYIFTLMLSSPRFGRYKKCAIGNESSLAAAEIKTFFQNASDDFYNVSLPPHRVNSCTGLLVAAENNTSLKTWYQVFPIAEGDNPPAGPVIVGNVTVTSSTAGQGAAYSIPITLGATNGLTGGSGTIAVVWPIDTSIPTSISNTTVTVNGVNATSVTTTPPSRQAVVTVPNNIAGGATVTLGFAAGAGLVNPTTPANYSLTVQTSAQPIDAISPPYQIAQAGVTPVTVGNLIVTPDTVTRAASYSIPITVGATGALTGGAGTITITWPNDTMVPASIANTGVTVNGTNASAVTTNSAARQTTVTVPSNLAGGALVTLLFNKTAGLKNPTTPGSYTLQAQTSAQPVNATSPAYNLNAIGPTTPPGGNTSSVLATRTKSPFDKSSQSKVFYLDNKWWTIAQDSVDSKWYLFGGTATSAAWTRGLKIDSRAGSRADMILDAANNRLYLVSSQGTTSYFIRLLYSGGNWAFEAQVSLAVFDHGDGANVVTITRAKNNNLWVFRINNYILEAQVSTDNGNTWSATMQLKTGLAGKYGQTDAVAFSAGGNYVGVFYAMASALGGTQIGFLKHLDSDPAATWTDESSSITFFGSESSENWVSANALNDGTVYAITRNKPGIAGVDPNNTLYKRSSGGTWSKFKVNTSTTWTSPTLAIDASNNRLLVMGIRTDAPNIGEYKWCALGNEGALASATPTVLLQHNADNFGHLSAPLTAATSATGLLVVGSNVTTDDLWYAKISLGAPKNAANDSELEQQGKLEAQIDSFSDVQTYPNPFNPATTIRFAVKEPATVKLQIFNIRGELVRTLAVGELDRGLYEKRWNGRDNTGRPAASGIYFYRLQIGAKVFNGRMQMLK